MTNTPLIVILGPTASGKSALAMELAQKCNGEIIAADSRTVYRGMDIGTAKPSQADQDQVKHHLLDIVDPDQWFSVADFQERAIAAIDDITSRGKVPFLVGGSGLYIDAVIYNFRFRKQSDPDERKKLERLSVAELQHLLRQRGISLPPNGNNPRHLIRTLETAGEVGERTTLRPKTLVIGLAKPAADLESAIRTRVDRMVESGFVAEVEKLLGQYGSERSALRAPGYTEFREYLAGNLTLEQAKQQFVRAHRQYAKRQMTWFKRNKDIVWISKTEDAVDLVTTFLNK